jgi:hypothetical protein
MVSLTVFVGNVDFSQSKEGFYEDGQQTISGAQNVMDKTYWLGAAGEGQWGRLFGGYTAMYYGGELKAGSGTSFTNIETAETHDSLDREAFLVNLEGTYNFLIRPNSQLASKSPFVKGDLGGFACSRARNPPSPPFTKGGNSSG